MLLVDTGVFLSAADRDEPSHARCAAVLRSRSDLVVPASVVPEASWLIESRLGVAAEVQWLELVTSRRMTIVDLVQLDYERSIELIRTYSDLGLGFVDASIVAIAERLDIGTIATLNHASD